MNIYLKLAILLNVFELTACIAGFLNWKKIKNSYWKWFPVYLAVIVAVEIVAELVNHVWKNRAINHHLYFYFAIPLQFLFFFWLFSRWHTSVKEKRYCYIGAGIYIAAWIVEFFVLSQSRLSFLSFSYTIGNIVLLLLILRFFIIFINSNLILGYRSEMMFWVCLGLLVFYLTTLPFFGLWNTLADKYSSFFNNYYIVQLCLDCLMYLFFTIGFMLGKWKPRFS
jgi:hypothetical protein